MRPSIDEWGLGIAKVTATRSTCLRRSVGAVLVDFRGHVIATGYNGVVSGKKHCNDKVMEKDGGIISPTYPYACSGALSKTGTNLDGCEAIHAEQNCLLKCSNVYAIYSCYVTVSPCFTCTKLLLNTACSRIVFSDRYAHWEKTKMLWEGSGREWIWFENKEPVAGLLPDGF